MKTLPLATVCTLSLLIFATAAWSEPSSNGDFQFGIEGASGAIQYDARTQKDGTSRGQISFDGAMEVSNGVVDDGGDGGTHVVALTMQVTVDCLLVRGNRAAMSGVITSANVTDYTGQRAVLTVEDNGEGANDPLDAFTWGVYRPIQRTWTPSDAEVEGDTGASLTWTATDAERTDDVGIPSDASTVVDCKSFPLSAYAMVPVPDGAGNIQVRP